MLPAKPDQIHVALNRVTFGARDLDVASVQATGWPAWVEDQLAPTVGDDGALAVHLQSQVMHIQYAAATPGMNGMNVGHEVGSIPIHLIEVQKVGDASDRVQVQLLVTGIDSETGVRSPTSINRVVAAPRRMPEETDRIEVHIRTCLRS